MPCSASCTTAFGSLMSFFISSSPSLSPGHPRRSCETSLEWKGLPAEGMRADGPDATGSCPLRPRISLPLGARAGRRLARRGRSAHAGQPLAAAAPPPREEALDAVDDRRDVLRPGDGV